MIKIDERVFVAARKEFLAQKARSDDGLMISLRDIISVAIGVYEQTKWLPISDAPQHGKFIIYRTNREMIGASRHKGKLHLDSCSFIDEDGNFPATHFQLFPRPPVAA